MSNIKDLFSKKLHVSKVETSKAEVESKDFIVEKRKERESFVPPIDFTTASNYIRFGSAKEYYANSIQRIYNTYPYDGSEKEKLQFRNDSTELDKYIFDQKYPKASGHAVFDGTSHIVINRGYKGATTPPSTKLAKLFDLKSVKHDADERRRQTFALNLDDGMTVEWWMKKDSFSTSDAEGIFSLSSSDGYIDIIAYGDTNQPLHLNASGSDNTFMAHSLVGTSGITSGSIEDDEWHHYAVSFYREDSSLKTNFYMDGVSKSIQTTSTDIGEISDAPTGKIGLSLAAGDIGLRADIDDFRFWNKKQSSEAIYNNYYRAIGGGANSDDFRTELSVYYKFNEGTTGVDSVDRVVLDYSGRIANGYWENYSASFRATGSAYTTDGDPIIRSTNTLVTDLEAEMESSGSLYDLNNNMSMYDLVPEWMRDEDNGELKKFIQIMAMYFDDLYAKIEYLPKLKDKRYFKDDEKALPFAKRLLEERGLIVPDILIERGVLEYFGQRDVSKVQFEKDIEEIKNKIYHNIYNNIEHIYKSKGTEKSYRNMLRCFGIDDEVVKLNLYTDNGLQYLIDKTKHTSVKTKHVDFDEASHFNATVYQENNVSGSGAALLEKNNAITLEAEVMVPRKPQPQNSWYYNTPFQSSSVFGLDSFDPSLNYGYVDGGIENNFQVYLVRDKLHSDRAKWVLKQKKFSTLDTSNTISGNALSFLTASNTNHCCLRTTGSGNSVTTDFYNSGVGNGVSISFWFKYEDHPPTENDILIFYKNTGNRSQKNLGFRTDGLLLRNKDQEPFGNKTGSLAGETLDYDFTQYQGEWKHYVLSVADDVVNGSGLNFYVDGQLTALPGTSSFNLVPVSLGGADIGGSLVKTLSGSYDDVLIINRQVSSTEVSDLYNGGYGLDTSSVEALSLYSDTKAYWTFDNASDNSVGTSGIELYDNKNSFYFVMADTAKHAANYALESHISAPDPVAGVTTETEVLTSSFYEEIYNNQRWNIAVKAYPEGYPFAGSYLTSSDPNYTLEFYGVSHNLDEVLHEFKLTASLPYATGSSLLSTPKKAYVGARRTHWTGSVEHRSDLKISALSLYYDKLDDESIKQHNLDPTNYGHNRVHSNPTPFLNTAEDTHLPAQHSLALHWDFQTVTASDTSGEFIVEDFSSASNLSRYDWLDNIVTNEHKGRGYGFPTSSAEVVKNEFIFASKKELPEISFTSDSIHIVGDEKKFLYEDEDVNDNVFTFEKSMYQSVSEEMLNMFSTIKEYANLISKPVDRYRMDYKRLAYARQLFFEKVDGNMDLDRFTDYFKWIDSSISVFLQQLHPANAKFNKGIADMVESHILERPKYQHIFPFIEKQTEIKVGQIKGPSERLYNWRTGHSPDYKKLEYNDKSIKIENTSYLKTDSDFATGSSGEMSVSFYFKSTDTTLRNVITIGDNFVIDSDSGTLRVKLKLQSDSSSQQTSWASSQDGNYIITYNGTGDADAIKLYKNSVLQTTSAMSVGAKKAIVDKLQVGNGSTEDKFDEISIWDKALTQPEIDSIYNTGIAVDLLSHASNANLVSYYRMGDHPSDPEIRPFQGYLINDSKGTNHLKVKGNAPSTYAEPLAVSFKLDSSSENIHCLWQRDRREDPSATRRAIQKALTTEAQEVQLNFADNSGTSYGGSTYASRRFSKPYSFKGEEQRAIHGGINYAPSKDRDFLKSATKIHGALTTGPSTVPEEVVTVGAGLAQGLIDQQACDDVIDPSKKEKLASNAVLGKFSNYTGTGPIDGSTISSTTPQFAYSVKGERILPMNLIEATSSTGYNKKIHDSFREGVYLTNLHSDTTSPTNEIPMQSPFTDTWVGGRQSRHVAINRYQSSFSTTNNLDSFTTRPEEWRLLIGEHEVDEVVDGALGFTGPDYGGLSYPNPDRSFAIYYRDGRAKRPVNVANHKTTDFFQGNYSENYEIVQTVGRLENNKVIKDLSDGQSLIAKDVGLPATTHETTFIGVTPSSNGNIVDPSSNRFTTEMLVFPTWSTGISSTKSVFASRFSAPGGFDVMSEAYLDAQAKEYSVYNSLNFRNYSVIEDSGEEFVNIPIPTTTTLKAIRSPATLLTPNVAGAHAPLVGMPALTSATGFSVSTWVKLDDEDTNIRTIYNDNTVSTVTGLQFQLGELIFRGSGGMGLGCEFKWSITYSDFLDWKHLCIAWDGDCNASVVKLYIDGVDQGVPTTIGGSAAFNHSITDLYLFDRNSASTAFELKGSLHDFVFWDTNLTSPQVNDIYNSGNPKDYSTLSFASDLLIWWKLGEESNLSSLQSGDSIPNSTILSPEASNITSGDLTVVTDNLVIEDSNHEGTTYTSMQRSLIRVNSHASRREGLNTLHARHCGQFGTDSVHGIISAADYNVEPSFHKIHRNTLIMAGDTVLKEFQNNFYVQSPIPSSDYNYSWVTSSLGDNYSVRNGTQKVFGYWPKDGILSSSSGFDSAIVFPTASEIFGS